MNAPTFGVYVLCVCFCHTSRINIISHSICGIQSAQPPSVHALAAIIEPGAHRQAWAYQWGYIKAMIQAVQENARQAAA